MTATAGCSVRTENNASRVLVENGGRAVATADVVEAGGVVQLRFNVDHGHLPVQVRRSLVTAVFELPALRRRRALQASIPLGDVELLTGLRTHCTAVETRAAGSTCLVDAMIDVTR